MQMRAGPWTERCRAFACDERWLPTPVMTGATSVVWLEGVNECLCGGVHPGAPSTTTSGTMLTKIRRVKPCSASVRFALNRWSLSANDSRERRPMGGGAVERRTVFTVHCVSSPLTANVSPDCRQRQRSATSERKSEGVPHLRGLKIPARGAELERVGELSAGDDERAIGRVAREQAEGEHQRLGYAR